MAEKKMEFGFEGGGDVNADCRMVRNEAGKDCLEYKVGGSWISQEEFAALRAKKEGMAEKTEVDADLFGGKTPITGGAKISELPETELCGIGRLIVGKDGVVTVAERDLDEPLWKETAQKNTGLAGGITGANDLIRPSADLAARVAAQIGGVVDFDRSERREDEKGVQALTYREKEEAAQQPLSVEKSSKSGGGSEVTLLTGEIKKRRVKEAAIQAFCVINEEKYRGQVSAAELVMELVRGVKFTDEELALLNKTIGARGKKPSLWERMKKLFR